MPLQRRIPKRGFTNIFRKEYAIVNVGDLNCFEDGTIVTIELLKEAGLVKKITAGVKILGDGELEKKLTIQVHKCSQQADEKITARGGKFEVI
jgi:large subunit ribosomal protein L15